MRRILAAIGLVAIVAIAGTGLVLSQQPPAPGEPGGSGRPGTTHLVPVVRTKLVATQPVSGQVTSSESWTVGLPSGSLPEQVSAAADAVAAATARLAGARTDMDAATRTRALVRARDNAVVASAPAGAARREAVRARSLDRIEQTRGVAAAGAAVAEAQRDLAAAERDVASRRATEAAPGGTITSLPAIGGTVARGEPLFALDGRPTLLLVGTLPAWRALREGDEGPDVAQLQENLVALGFGGTPAIRADGIFDAATMLAVRRWQTAANLEPSGVVRLGDTIVLPAEVRISAAHVAVGGATEPGAPMLDVASIDEVVRLVIDPGLAPKVHVGDPIRFGTPEGTGVPGTVLRVGAPTPSTVDGPNGPAGLLEVEVVAAADDPAALAPLDGVTLTADVVTGTAPDALAVPVSALVVLGDGSFGVEVASAGSTHFIRVTPGIYDRTMVQVEGDGIAEGDLVMVPGT